jgi:hypothetical protein
MMKQLSKIPRRIVMYTASLVALALIYYFFIAMWKHMPELSGLPYAMTKALLGVITFRAIDDFVYPEVDSSALFNRNSQAYAIYMLAYALIVAGAMWTA